MLGRSIALLAAGAISLAAPTSPNGQASASNGTFNLLSIGVDGYPASLEHCGLTDSDKMRNTEYIGLAIGDDGYDIINFQEDLHYHESLTKPLRRSFFTETSGDVPSGSGLNTFSNYSWVDFSRTKWDSCGNGCAAALGFTFMRVRIDEGVYIDMINLDINSLNDQAAKRANINQLSEFIRTQSEGNAVIVSGNTATFYSRHDDIRTLFTENGLTDAWVKAIGDSGSVFDMPVCPESVPPNILCESEQKILYRGSRAMNLTAYGFYYDTARFESPEGYLLSSRYPVRAEFVWDLNPLLRQSKPFGGPYGKRFTDMTNLPGQPEVASITLRGANRLDGLTIAYSGHKQTTFTHGGSGGKAYTLNLDQGEHIVSVHLCRGKKNGHARVFYAKANTNKGRSVEAGKTTDDCETFNAPDGFAVAGTFGRDGKEMDQLGFIHAKLM
ncbi:endonuclease/exonuclease/phosphatase family protein [Rhizoctonia solani AG-3 Rhs1AP]|uniref:Endonuclease/exonuclease/phosphatase family protein n=1 Tax=Rhizoctonia solani AG-3 Rhs1AP TaxID=1086054 RepID=X8JI67_9AGAM|nr:endonuclease/exonuclease/phosphatase family protein [Rhizoctonia solani AG-3 Rhs1AP]